MPQGTKLSCQNINLLALVRYIPYAYKKAIYMKIIYRKKAFDADPGWEQFGSGMEKSRIRDLG
jgi:hypothetical protein